MTTRRRFVIGGAMAAIVVSRAAAQTRPVRIGILSGRPLKTSAYGPPLVRALAALGYRDGAGAIVEYRSNDGFADRYAKQGRELIDLKCDVIFVFGSELAVRALMDLRSAVPTVFWGEFDPVEKGIVSSFARPGGNVTGVWNSQRALVAKRVQILREIVPTARRFLVLADVWSKDHVAGAREAAAALGIELTVVEFPAQPYDFASAFKTGRQARVDGVVVLNSPVFMGNIAELLRLAMENRLPSAGTAYPGILVSYYANLESAAGQVARVGARILKGAKPADIPVEQIGEFELAINGKTARALGLKIPESVLARATRIVQ